MGEVWSLSIAERRQALETMIAAADGALPIGVVTTHASIAETLALSRHAAAAGAAHIVLMRPAGLFSNDEIIDFVRLTCDAAGCKVVSFDSEAQGGGYPVGVIRQLADEGCIHAVKCTHNAHAIADVRDKCRGTVAVCNLYKSHARRTWSDLSIASCTQIRRLTGFQLIRRYFEDHQRGEFGSMIERHSRLEPLRRRTFGQPCSNPNTKATQT